MHIAEKEGLPIQAIYQPSPAAAAALAAPPPEEDAAAAAACASKLCLVRAESRCNLCRVGWLLSVSVLCHGQQELQKIRETLKVCPALQKP